MSEKEFIIPIVDHQALTFELLKSIHEYIQVKMQELNESVVVTDPTIIKERYENLLQEFDQHLLTVAEGCVKQIESSEKDSFAAIMFYDEEDDPEHVGVRLEFSKEKFNEKHPSHRIIKSIYDSVTQTEE